MTDMLMNRERMEEEKKRKEYYEIMLEEFMLSSGLFDQTFTSKQLREIKERFQSKNPNILDPNALEDLKQSIREWRQYNFGRLISSARPDKDGLITAYAGGITPAPVPSLPPAPVPSPPPAPVPSPPPSPAPPSAPSPNYDKGEIFSFDREGKLLTNAEDVRSLNVPFTQQGQKRRRKSKKKSRKSKSSKKKSKSSKKKSKSSKKRSKSFKKNLRSKSKIKRK